MEDEFHFILVCNEYNELRIKKTCLMVLYIKKLLNILIIDKFVHVMKYEWKLLSKYLIKTWSKRKSIKYYDMIN